MTTWDDITGQLWVLPIGAIVLVIVLWRGWLRREALSRRPRRDLGLGPFDLGAGLGLVLMGLSAAALLIHQLVPVGDDGRPVYASTMQQAAAAALGQLLTGLPPMVYLLWRAGMKRGGWRRLGVVPRRPLRDLLAAVGGLLVSLPLVFSTILLAIIIGMLVGQPPPRFGHEMLSVLHDSQSRAATALLGVSAVVLAPVFEEFFYRGLMQSTLLAMLPRRRWTVVLITAAAFALVHLGAAPWHAMAGLFVLGVVLGWLYERTGSLWPPILVHAGFNAVNFTVVLSLAE